MKRILLLFVTIAGVLLAAPSAHASGCGGWYTGNRDGEYGQVSNVVPMRGMNCASSRYVVNKWLKPAYQRQWSARIPTNFYDGYVTWYCHKTSRFNWRCDEYDSGTAFRFRAVYFG